MCCQDINYSLKLMGVYDSSLFIACGQRFDMISTVMEKTKKEIAKRLTFCITIGTCSDIFMDRYSWQLACNILVAVFPYHKI
jgi:hypothetical protein